MFDLQNRQYLNTKSTTIGDIPLNPNSSQSKNERYLTLTTNKKSFSSKQLSKIRTTILFLYHKDQALRISLFNPIIKDVFKLRCFTLANEMITDVNFGGLIIFDTTDNDTSTSKVFVSDIPLGQSSNIGTTTIVSESNHPKAAVTPFLNGVATATAGVFHHDASSEVKTKEEGLVLSSANDDILKSISNMKIVRGKSSGLIHTTNNTLAGELIRFKTNNNEGGALIKKYVTFLEKNYNGGKSNLPSPISIYQEDDSCLILESYRRSSKANEILRLIQRYVIDPYTADQESITIAFWSICEKEVPSTPETIETNNKYFKDNCLTVISDSYSERGNIILSTKPHGVTKMEINLELAYDDSKLEIIAVEKRLQASLDMVVVAGKHFERCDEVDEDEITHYVNEIMPNLKPLTDKEEKDISDCTEILMGEENQTFKRISKPNDEVEKFRTINKDKSITVKGVVKLDERIERILAYYMHYTSNERNKNFVEINGNLERTCEFDYETHSCHCVGEVKSPAPLTNRMFRGRQTWRKGWKGNENAYVIAMLADKVEAKTSSSGAVIASTYALVVLEYLAPRITKVTQLQKTDLALGEGLLGVTISNYTAKYTLGFLDHLHLKYQRTRTVTDEEMRNSFIAKIASAPSTKEEAKKVVQECEDLVLEFDTKEGLLETKLKKLSHSSEISMKRKQKRGWCERSIAMGRCSDIIDAPAVQALAWLNDNCSNERMRLHREGGHIARLVLSDDGRCSLCATVKRLPKPLKNRDFITQNVWWEDPTNHGTYYFAAASVDVQTNNYRLWNFN